MEVAVGALEEAAATGGEIEGHARRLQPQALEVEHVEVGLVAGGDDAPITQADGLGGGPSLLVHRPRQLEARPDPIPTPVRQQRRREAGVADGPDMGAAVPESRDGVGVGEHLGHGIEVAVGVVEERQVEQRTTAVGEQGVDEPLGDGDPGSCRERLGAPARRRFVQGRVAQHVDPARRERHARLGQLDDQARPRFGLGQTGHPVDERQRSIDRSVGGERSQRVQRGLDAHEDPDRARGHLGSHGQTVGVGSVEEGEHGAVSAPSTDLGERERQRKPGLAHHRQQRLGLGVELGEVRHDLQHAGAGGADGPGDAHQFAACRIEGRDRVTGARAVVGRAAGGEAEGAGGDALGREAPHGRDVRIGRRLPVGATSAHDVQAERAVHDLGGEVDVPASGVEVVEVVGEGRPLPGEALVQDRAGQVLDTLHEGDELRSVSVVDGGEPDPAVARDHGRHPVRRRRRERLVPGGLAVVVGVDVDEAGGDHRTVGIDLTSPAAGHPSDLDDDPVGDRHVGEPGRRAGAVDDVPSTDHQVCDHDASPGRLRC